MKVFFGENSYAVEQAARKLRDQVGPPGTVEANSHAFAGGQVSLGQLRAVCDAMPFLAERRLVVVDGLLSRFDPRQAQEGSDVPSLGEWEGLEALVKAMPETTILVFTDGQVHSSNPLLKRLRPLGEVFSFQRLKGEELARWAKEQVSARKGQIAPGALALLEQLSDPDQQALENELEKLCLYATGRPITEEDVRALVPETREANIFAAVDALLEGRTAQAARLFRRLQDEGETFSRLMSMIARQLRLLVIAKDLAEAGAKQDEIGHRLGVRSDFVVRKTVETARRYPWATLRALYAKLLEADLRVKRGLLTEDLSLEVLIGELAPRR